MFDKDLKIIIPAATYGARIKALGAKCLFKVWDETILKRQLRLIQKNFPSSQIIVVSGYRSSKVLSEVKKFNATFKNAGSKNVIVVENKDYEETGSSHSINVALTDDTKRCLILYGDLIFSEKYLSGIDTSQNSLVVDNNNFFEEKEVGVVCSGNTISNIDYSLPTKWCQTVFLEKDGVDLFKSICNKRPKTYYGFEILKKMIGQIKFGYTYNSSWIVEADSSESLERINRYAEGSCI